MLPYPAGTWDKETDNFSVSHESGDFNDSKGQSVSRLATPFYAPCLPTLALGMTASLLKERFAWADKVDVSPPALGPYGSETHGKPWVSTGSLQVQLGGYRTVRSAQCSGVRHPR